MAQERKNRRFILANPDEPQAGDYAYGLYEKAHPIRGDAETVSHFKKELAGLRGERVTLFFNGKRIDAETDKEHTFRLQRTFVFRKYADVFGAGSAYASAIHFMRDAHSDDELLIMSIALEIADDDAEDFEE